MMSNSMPPARARILFCLLLGVFSTFFAEVASGSTLFAFTSSFGLLFVFPLYVLHITVLSAIVFGFGRPRFYALYAAGTLFGMYEAYMTKILWISFLPNGPLVKIGGVGLIELLVLVFFWHPLMAFIVPLGISERLLTSSRTVPLIRTRGRRFLWVMLATLLGANQGVYTHSPLRSLLAGAVAMLVLGCSAVLWRRTGFQHYGLSDLLFSGKGLALAIVLLLADYMLLTKAIKPEKLPAISSQVTIWILYAILLTLFVAHLRKSQSFPVVDYDDSDLSLGCFEGLLLLMTISSAIVATVLGGIPGFGAVVFPVLLGLSSLAGMSLLGLALFDLLRRSPSPQPARAEIACTAMPHGKAAQLARDPR